MLFDVLLSHSGRPQGYAPTNLSNQKPMSKMKEIHEKYKAYFTVDAFLYLFMLVFILVLVLYYNITE